MKKTNLFAATLLLAIAGTAHAVPVEYSFDTVTAIDLHGTTPSLSGVLENTNTVQTVQFLENTNISFRYVVSRCVPLFLVAMEKPGRYRLKVTVDSADTNLQLKACRLELR